MATYALFENTAYLSADQLIKSGVIWYIDMLSTAGQENARFPDDVNHQDFIASDQLTSVDFHWVKYGLKETSSPNFFFPTFPLNNLTSIPTNADLAISTWKLLLSTVQGLSTGGVFPVADMILVAENETLYGFGTHLQYLIQTVF